MTSENRSNKVQILAECGMLLAIGAVLSVFPKFEGLWPNGGSITLCSMLPVILISYRHGVRWGLLSGVAFGLIQILTGLRGLAGMDLWSTIGVLALDYLAAYVVLGLGGILKGKLKKPAAALVLGTLLVLLLRYLIHTLSGVILFGSYAEWFLGQEGFPFGNWLLARLSGPMLVWVYSLLYNGSYMLPEMMITSLGALLVSPVAEMRLRGGKREGESAQSGR